VSITLRCTHHRNARTAETRNEVYRDCKNCRVAVDAPIFSRASTTEREREREGEGERERERTIFKSGTYTSRCHRSAFLSLQVRNRCCSRKARKRRARGDGESERPSRVNFPRVSFFPILSRSVHSSLNWVSVPDARRVPPARCARSRRMRGTNVADRGRNR